MGIHLKRTAKALALDAAAAPILSSSGSLTRAALQGLKIGFEPPDAVVGVSWPEPAAACVSIDFDVTRPGREGPNRTGTFALVELSEKYGIPLTWAICGRTAEEDGKAYSRILDSTAEHEIGIHTYSHMDASRSSADELEAEIERCIAALGLSSPPRTFVFPWNREAHFDVLKRMGFLAYRGKKRVVGGVSKAKGLWNIPPVYYVDQESVGRGVPDQALRRHLHPAPGRLPPLDSSLEHSRRRRKLREDGQDSPRTGLRLHGPEEGRRAPSHRDDGGPGRRPRKGWNGRSLRSPRRTKSRLSRGKEPESLPGATSAPGASPCTASAPSVSTSSRCATFQRGTPEGSAATSRRTTD